MSANIGEGKYVISVDSSGAINQLNQFGSKADQTSKQVSGSFKQGLASAVSLTAGITSLAFQFDNLDRAQLRVRKTALEMSRAQEEVNKLVQDGKKDTLDYQQAIERLAIATEKNRQAQTDATQGQIAFGLSIAQTALTIPAAIQGIQGLTSATSILNIVNSKWILIALAVIAAYEGITQAIKHFTGQDYTITGAVGKMINSMNGLNQTSELGTQSMVAYGDSIAYTGVIAQNSTQQLQSFGKAIDVANVKIASSIDNLKKNENKLTDEIEATAITLGVDLDSVRNFGSMGTTDQQNKLFRSVSTQINNIFRSIRSTGQLSTSKNLHGNFGNGIGISQAIANTLTTPSNRLKKTTGRSSKHGGFKPGWGVQEVEKPFLQGHAKLQSLSDELRLFGVNLDAPSFNLSSRVSGYRSPSNEFMQTSIRQATAEYEQNVRDYERRIMEEKTKIGAYASRAGLSYSDYLNLEMAGRGSEVRHIIEYRERLAAMSSGTA